MLIAFNTSNYYLSYGKKNVVEVIKKSSIIHIFLTLSCVHLLYYNNLEPFSLKIFTK